jgi:hypothetical protein
MTNGNEPKSSAKMRESWQKQQNQRMKVIKSKKATAIKRKKKKTRRNAK